MLYVSESQLFVGVQSAIAPKGSVNAIAAPSVNRASSGQAARSLSSFEKSHGAGVPADCRRNEKSAPHAAKFNAVHQRRTPNRFSAAAALNASVPSVTRAPHASVAWRN